MKESAADKPMVAVAVPEGSLRERLLSVLESAAVDVCNVNPNRALWRSIADHDADVVILSRAQIPPADIAAIDSLTDADDSPEIVVVTDRESPVDRAHLLAVGAAHVVNEDSSNREIEVALEKVAAAAADGGLDGPEVGGNAVEPRLADFMSRSPRMRDFVRTVQKVVDTDTSLLITGETGVGKERLARAVHAESPRADGPFVAVNCGALAETLLESELFGHEKGAFTGADSRRRGQFELANGGTLFLDEICEMPSALQVKLLTALQRREVTPVGSEKPRRVDVRIMAATNGNVEAEVRTGRFREDLYYRLHVMPLEIPPLRERREDIPDLAGSVIGHFRETMGRSEVESIDRNALAALMRYDFPGNVRELVNVIERAMIECEGTTLSLKDLPPRLRLRAEADSPPPVPAPSRGDGDPFSAEWFSLPLREARRKLNDQFEKTYLEAHLRRTGGAVGQTARAAGITPRSLHEKMKRHRLRKEDFRA